MLRHVCCSSCRACTGSTQAWMYSASRQDTIAEVSVSHPCILRCAHNSMHSSAKLDRILCCQHWFQACQVCQEETSLMAGCRQHLMEDDTQSPDVSRDSRRRRRTAGARLHHLRRGVLHGVVAAASLICKKNKQPYAMLSKSTCILISTHMHMRATACTVRTIQCVSMRMRATEMPDTG